MFGVLDTNHFAEMVHDTVLGERLKERLVARGAEVFTTVISAQEVTEGWCAFIRKQRAGVRSKFMATISFSTVLSC